MTEQERREALRAGNMAKFHGNGQPPWELTDETFPISVPLLIGRKIISVEREPSSGESFEQCANWVTVGLDDGSVLHFQSYGYDADGVITSYSPPS